MPPDSPSDETLPGFQALTFDPEQCRQDLAALDSQKVFCCTFDELLRGLKRKLTVYAAETDGQ